MNIKIKRTVDNKNLEKERIIFNVVENDFLGAYIVLKTKKTGEKTVSSRTEGTYWFPDKDVKKGDLVVLYTKKGINTEKKNGDGTTTYFYYWQMENTLWNNVEDVVLLTRLQEWNFEVISSK